MKAYRVLASCLLCLASLPLLADVTFKTSQVKVAGHPLKVELAIEEPQRLQGLMFRKSLGKEDGMLFIFDEPAYHSIWMKNTLIPLSVAFVDKDGVILNIEDMEPQTLDSHTAAGPAVYAIETNKGWYAGKKAGRRQGHRPACNPDDSRVTSAVSCQSPLPTSAITRRILRGRGLRIQPWRRARHGRHVGPRAGNATRRARPSRRWPA